MSQAKRSGFLTLMAVLFAILALSNATKFLQAMGGGTSGFVLFGLRFHDLLPNLLLGLPFAAMLGAYSFGLWNRKRWVTFIAVPYALYVPVNLTLFWFFAPNDNLPPVGFILGYLVFAVGGSVGTALYLMRHYDELT